MKLIEGISNAISEPPRIEPRAVRSGAADPIASGDTERLPVAVAVMIIAVLAGGSWAGVIWAVVEFLS
jgi:hypothetical protein